MARLIDADAIIEDLELLAKHEESFRQSVILGVVHTVKVRSTIDAVEVVRCKDCKHYEIHKPKVLENCERNGYLIPMKPDDFCAYGERKDGDGNG